MPDEDKFFLSLLAFGLVTLLVGTLLAFSCETKRMEQNSEILRECIAAGHDPLLCKEVR